MDGMGMQVVSLKKSTITFVIIKDEVRVYVLLIPNYCTAATREIVDYVFWIVFFLEEELMTFKL